MDIINNSIIQGKLVGSTFTLELLIDKINKTNPKGEWLQIVEDLKQVVETEKKASLFIYDLIEKNNLLKKLNENNISLNREDILKKVLLADELIKQNKLLKKQLVDSI